jgi:RNA-directed DNA polymerase
MKVRHRKGVAIHSGPESCGAGREADVEALTGEAAGQPLSREIDMFGAPTQLCNAEGETEGSVHRELPEGSARSKTLSMRGNPSYGNWEVSSAPEIGQWPMGALGKADGRNPEEQPDEKSDACIVPRNDLNNGSGSKPLSAEDQEGRRAAKRNAGDFPAPRTQSRTSASMGMDSVREAAGRDKNLRFTALLHHITPDLLAESFMDLKRSAAAGVDGVTWREYDNGLDDRIALLWDAVQSGRYRAQPSRRFIFRRRMGHSGRWALPRWRTRSSSRRWSRC